MASEYLSRPLRTEPEVRLARLKADMKSEGASDEMIARCATLENAERLADYEAKTLTFIADMFRPKP